MATSRPGEPIVPVPAPWTLKGTVYGFLTYATSSDVPALAADRSFLYSPFEAGTSFADGKFLGGLGMVQVIRYTESPVGPYDELLIVPGKFGYQKETARGGGSAITEEQNLRITRIYVSQKETCWNGRTNWNIPKHLARFSFKELPNNGGLSIEVFPHDTSGMKSESKPSTVPFFSAIYKPISYLPSVPISTAIAKYVGLDLNLVQPPLPNGENEAQELAGSDRWNAVIPYQYSRKTSLGWWDMEQHGASENDSLLAARDNNAAEREGHEHFWPGSGRWRIGMKMEDALIGFPEGTHWDKSRF